MSRPSWFWWLLLLAALGAAAWAFVLRWTCDDAYISFRYAQHLVEGHGLVFNLDPSEAPVEGYTNFSWTLLLALGMQLGCTGDAIEPFSQALGIAMHAGTVLLLGFAAFRLGGGRAVVPIAALGYAAHHHAASLAPAGLETAMFVLLGVAMAYATMVVRTLRGGLVLGLLAVLAAMTRPDGALFVMASGGLLFLDALRGRGKGPLIGCSIPLLLLFVPYLLWRHSYYGYWVPNTFYAKSGGDPYPGQGLRYAFEYLRAYWVLALPIAALLLLPLRRRAAAAELVAVRSPALVLLAYVVPYVAFVVWVGGDFMFSRFLLPVTPLLLLSLDLLFCRARPWLQASIAVVVTAGMLLWLEADWLAVHPNPLGFSDNRTISVARMRDHDITRVEAFRAAGHYLHDLFRDLPVRIAITGSHANLAYRSDVPVAIECATGLTDAYIAHLEVGPRGIPGHEKNYTRYPDYLRQRGVHFMFDLGWRDGTKAQPSVVDLLNPIKFPSQPVPTPAFIVLYDRALMQELKRRDPQVQFNDIDQSLDRYIAELMPKQPKDVVAKDLARLRLFYFDHNDDPQRLRAITEYLAK